MKTAEMKLDLFRKIDRLKDDEIEVIYKKFVSILENEKVYDLNKAEKKAIDEAVEVGEKNKKYSLTEVKNEARKKYPGLKFK
jgi:F420-0:gamma-glutamyl ligase